MSSPEWSALTPQGTALYRGHIDEAASTLRGRTPEIPSIGILSDVEFDPLCKEGTVSEIVPFADIPNFPATEGEICIGTVGGTRIVELNQRMHLYAGDTPREVAFPVRMLASAGVETLVLPSFAGGVNPQFDRGDLMVVTDHINFQGRNPLVGPNVKEWGPRFPDMTEPYDNHLQQVAGQVARREGLSLQKGVYLGLLGPSPETPAELRMVRRLGADAVGMSLVPEVITARHMDVRVLAVTLLTANHLSQKSDSLVASDGTEEFEEASAALRRLTLGVIGTVGADVAG